MNFSSRQPCWYFQVTCACESAPKGSFPEATFQIVLSATTRVCKCQLCQHTSAWSPTSKVGEVFGFLKPLEGLLSNATSLSFNTMTIKSLICFLWHWSIHNVIYLTMMEGGELFSCLCCLKMLPIILDSFHNFHMWPQRTIIYPFICPGFSPPPRF